MWVAEDYVDKTKSSLFNPETMKKKNIKKRPRGFEIPSKLEGFLEKYKDQNLEKYKDRDREGLEEFDKRLLAGYLKESKKEDDTRLKDWAELAEKE